MTSSAPDRPGPEAGGPISGPTSGQDPTVGAQTAAPPDHGPPDPEPLDPEPLDQGPRARWEEVRELGRLRRSRHDRKVAGVAGGLARHLDVDPLVLRIAFVVLVFFGGSGLILYLAGWLFVPDEDTGRAHVRLDPRSRSVVLVVALGIAGLAVVGDTAGGVGVPWPLVVVGLLTVLVVVSRSGTSAGASPRTATEVDPTPQWQVPGSEPAALPYAPYPAAEPRPYRGPVLFWFALAAIALALGLLAAAEGAGLAVAGGAYPALALAVVGGMLVLGSVWGRPGGLIALGLLATLAAGVTAAVSAADGTAVVAPTTAAELDGSYGITAGELVVDLSGVTDLEALDGRTLELDARFGRLELVVPPGLDVTGRTRVVTLGESDVFGARSTVGGPVSLDGGPDVPTLIVDAEVDYGEIVLHQSEGILR